jgi:CDGSH-type Zn-finger protein
MDEPSIKVTEDGPYHVRGLPVRRARIVTDEERRSVGWEVDEPLTTGEPVRLCRCGRSNTKPFCDSSHLQGFDGTETADRAPTDTRREGYEGPRVVITDDESFCVHARFCTSTDPDVWTAAAEAGTDDEVEAAWTTVVRCPSGRLVLIDPHAGELEADYQREVLVVDDGPYWVRGGVPVEAVDGHTWEVRNRVTLCRCGHSGNKPFCDGTHSAVGFRDRAPATAEPSAT